MTTKDLNRALAQAAAENRRLRSQNAYQVRIINDLRAQLEQKEADDRADRTVDRTAQPD